MGDLAAIELGESLASGDPAPLKDVVKHLAFAVLDYQEQLPLGVDGIE